MSRAFRFGGVDYPLPPTASRLPSVMLLGMPKSGTTLLSKIFQLACQELGVVHLPVHDMLFQSKFRPSEPELEQLRAMFDECGYCYGAFRHPYPFLRGAHGVVPRTIWIRRDPRDVIVSRYFSEAFNHPAPGASSESERYAARRQQLQQHTADTFARGDAQAQAELARGFLEIAPTDGLDVYHYEDVIYEKPDWIRSMMQRCGWQLPDAAVERIATAVDEVPDREDATRFVRQVHPGNHAKHLSEATIRHIDEQFAATVPEWTRRHA